MAAAVDYARRLLSDRRGRDAAFLDIDHGEPAWDLLLDLFVSESEGVQVCVSSACIAACVPTSTALRHIDRLVTAGHVHREEDAMDRRRVFIHLSDTMRDRLASYLRSRASRQRGEPSPSLHFNLDAKHQ
ncbi:MAG TPA: MarR family transcriptional regulator [Allosphingosinicella sp.]|nr:MarR family transcriptional regulator [Allosphingosinicella sp.]